MTRRIVILMNPGEKGAYSDQASRFRKATHDIEALDSLTTGTFDNVVLGAQHDKPTGARVESPRNFNDVRADDIFCIGQRFAVEQSDEWFVTVS